MLEFDTSTAFRRDYKRLIRTSRYPDFEDRFQELAHFLLTGRVLPPKYKEHKLLGKFVGCHECHMAPDLLLIYRYKPNFVELIRLGSHSELF